MRQCLEKSISNTLGNIFLYNICIIDDFIRGLLKTINKKIIFRECVLPILRVEQRENKLLQCADDILSTKLTFYEFFIF